MLAYFRIQKSGEYLHIRKDTRDIDRLDITKHQLMQHIFLELVSKELNHLAAILHVYAGGLNFMK